MSHTISCTAATLRSMLCFVDSGATPMIACYSDSMAQPLADKLREAVGDRGGSQPISVRFEESEGELLKEFSGVAGMLESVFHSLAFCSR